MKHTKSSKSTNKIWIILFSVLALLCVGWIALTHVLPMGNIAVISKDGQELYRIDLSLVTESYTIPLDGNTILVEHGKISMQSAECPDKLCVHQGTIRTNGRIVCLPNHVLIEIEHGDNAPDAKVG